MATIKKIAERAGVSIGTVDRVIHNREHVSKETERRVKQAIEELNYTPNFFAQHLKLSKIFKFGVLMPKLFQDRGYWEIPAKGINKAQEELYGHKVRIKYFHYDRYSHISFSNVCQQVLETDLDGLLIAPVLSSVAEEFISKIPPNLPYVFFDSIIPDTNYLTCIVQDSFLSGVLSARLMQMLVREGTVAIIRIYPEDYHICERVKGFNHFYEEDSNIKTIIYDANIKADQADFHQLTNRIVYENRDLRGVFVTNALTYRVAEYLKSNSIDKKIHIIGYDLIEKNVAYLKEGFIDFLISQQPARQGYQGIYSLYRHVVLKERVNEKIMMPLDIITKENIEYYLK